MKKIVLKVVKQCVATDDVEPQPEEIYQNSSGMGARL